MTTAAAGIQVTCAATLDDALARTLYVVYREAFDELDYLAAARHVLHEHEFLEEMRDPRIVKYVAWDESGSPVAMTTLTSVLEAVPWISPAYFRHRFPAHAARNAVYYIGFVLTAPGARRRGAIHAMAEPVGEKLAAEQAVLAYDISRVNDDTIGFGKLAESILQRRATVEVTDVDQQTYYAATFTRPQPET